MAEDLPPNSQGLLTTCSLQRLAGLVEGLHLWLPLWLFCLSTLFGDVPQFLQIQYLLVLVVQWLGSDVLGPGQVLFGDFLPTTHTQKEERWGTRRP